LGEIADEVAQAVDELSRRLGRAEKESAERGGLTTAEVQALRVE